MAEPQTRSRRLFVNTIFGVLSWLMPIAIGLVATPIIVRSLGKSDFGIYATVLGFVSYSFTFGVGKILVKYVAEFRASGETEKIGPAVSATFWFSLTIAVVGSSFVALGAKWIVAEILKVPPEQQAVTEIALYLACGAIVVTMLSQIFQHILQGLHRFGSFLLFTNISGILLNSGNIGLALTGYGVAVLLVWNLVALTIMAGVFGLFAVRGLPEFSIRPTLARSMANPVVRYASSVILYQIFGNILFVFERAYIIRNFGAEAATYYLVPMTIGIYLQGVVMSAFQAIFPMMNEVLDDRVRLIQLYQKSTKLVLGMVVFAVVTLVICGRILLTVWIDREMAEMSYVVLVLHALTFSLTALMMSTWALAEGFRAASLNAFTTFVWMVVAISLILFAFGPSGNNGVALSRMTGVLVMMPIILYSEKRFLGSVQLRFWAAVLWRLAIAGVVAAAFEYGLFSVLELPGWLSLLLASAGGGLVFLATLVATGFVTREERDIFRGFLVRTT